ncbi:Gfo/Idh/MocA family oxidoreductase [Phycicoccus ginsengisoli]
MPELTLPPPRTPDPHDAPALRWGVLAPGGIARAFTDAIHTRSGQRVVAVGSRDLGRAQEFAADFGVATAHGSYEELVTDPDVDAVYIASPHSEHRDHALLALGAGKPVLVEKAFTRNASEAREVVETARAAGLFAMEAMWTRFLPHVDVVRRCLEDGLLGEVHTVFADHGQKLFPAGPQRLWDPALAGGALLDLGIYPVSFASFALGTRGGFSAVTAHGTVTDTGVDGQEGVVLEAASGAVASVLATMLTKTPTTASICGTRARLDLSGDFYTPGAVVRLVSPDHRVLDEYTSADREFGLHHEAVEVARRVGAGELESPLLPLDETVAIMGTLDEVRRQLGVSYPGE